MTEGKYGNLMFKWELNEKSCVLKEIKWWKGSDGYLKSKFTKY